MVLFLVYHPTGSLEGGGKNPLPKQKAQIDHQKKKKKKPFPSRPSCTSPSPPTHPKLPSSPAHPRKAAFTPGDPVESEGLRHSDLGGCPRKFPPGLQTPREERAAEGLSGGSWRLLPVPRAGPPLASAALASPGPGPGPGGSPPRSTAKVRGAPSALNPASMLPKVSGGRGAAAFRPGG